MAPVGGGIMATVNSNIFYSSTNFLKKKSDKNFIVPEGSAVLATVSSKNFYSCADFFLTKKITKKSDKNFMVPVGGAILATVNSNDSLVEAVSRIYPGKKK
jgi:hypothetical protein